MKSGFVPSYVSKSRHGIYYFRCRIPLSVRNKYNLSKTEIKKSLHTSSHSDAVKKARRLWVELIDENAYETDHLPMIAIGKPKGKIDIILHLPKAVERIRELYGVSGDDSAIPYMSHYLSKLGDDPDIVSEFIKYLTEDEKRKLADYEPFKRASIVLGIHNRQKTTSSTNPVHRTTQTPIKLEPFITEYLDEVTKNYKRNKKREMPVSSYNETKRPLKVFSAVIEQLTIGEITKDHIKKYVDFTYEVPCGLNTLTGYTDLDNYQIIRKHWNKISKIDFGEFKKKSNGTIGKEFRVVKRFLKWLKNEEYINRSLYNHIPAVSTHKVKKPKSLFTEDDYRLYFNSEFYTKGTHKSPSDYWIPLIAIFTGCRIEEIGSLFKENIIKEHNKCCLVITEDTEIGKNVKNESAMRIIPIHNQLIQLGFLDYTNNLLPNSQLFPELKQLNGRFTRKWDDKFNKYRVAKKKGTTIINKDGTTRMERGLLARCGIQKTITNENGIELVKTFHSFRHFFTNEMDKMKGADRAKNIVVGHKYKGTLVSNYIHPDKDDLLAGDKMIQQLKYPSIDFSKILQMEW